jgi:hypothetical protein
MTYTVLPMTAGHHRTDLYARRIRGRIVHPSAHVGVEREEHRAQQYLPRCRHRHSSLFNAEVFRADRCAGASRENDTAIDGKALRHEEVQVRGCG